MPVGSEKNGFDNRLFDLADFLCGRKLRGIVDFYDFPVCFGDAKANAGSRCDEGEVKLPLQSFLDDFSMEKAKESAAVANSKRGRTFGLIVEGEIIESQLN